MVQKSKIGFITGKRAMNNYNCHKKKSLWWKQIASKVRRMSLYAMSIVLSNFSQGRLVPNTTLKVVEMVGGEEKNN